MGYNEGIDMKSTQYSFIIPTLNEEKFLPLLLDSLVCQTEKNFEVIVVDGKSQDKTQEIANTYKKKFPITILESPIASLPFQRNLGASNAKGSWLIFADADTVFLPYFLSRCHQYIDAKNPRVLATWFSPDSEVGGDTIITLFANISLELSLLIHRPITPGPLTIVSREAFDKVHGYDETHAFGEDYDFGLRLDKAGERVHVLRETVAIWSLRRMRKEGKISVVQKYAASAAVALITRHPLKSMPGYIMGGHLYNKKKKPIEIHALRNFNKQLQKMITDFFK